MIPQRLDFQQVFLRPLDVVHSPIDHSLDAVYCGDVIDSDPQLETALELFTADALHLGPELSRIRYRLIFTKDYLASKPSNLESYIEAIGEMDNDLCVVYLAQNLSQRHSVHQMRQKVVDNILRSRNAIRVPLQSHIQKAEVNGYSIEVLNSSHNLDNLLNLYQQFNWDQIIMESYISDPNVEIVVATYEDLIVSTGMTITNDYQIGKKKLRFVEITWASTLKSHTERGLYSAVAAKLTVLQQSRHVDFLYGECNGLSHVLNIVGKLGRQDSMQFSDHLGYPELGILDQEVIISGSYCDLVLMSMPQSRLNNLQ